MSEADDDLRELAANRGCKLTKSRRRKPGGDFGRYGLKDAKTGREVFGFGAGRLTATAEEIRSFLRSGGASSWQTSLRQSQQPRPEPAPRKAGRKSEPAAAPTRERAKTSEPGPTKAAKAKPPSEPKRPPEPRLVIREAKAGDVEAIAELIASLGYEAGKADIKRRLRELGNSGQPVLVAASGKSSLLGVLTTSVMVVLHRPRPVGRISLLVVAKDARGSGVGTALVAEAAERLEAAGCGLLEVTSNMKRLRAHGFYERLGFERTSYRFVKTLGG